MMVDKTFCVYKSVKSRHEFVKFLHDNIPATVNINALLDRLSYETMDIDYMNDDEIFYLNTLSVMLYEFFIEDFRELEKFIEVNDSDFFYFFPVGFATREIFIYFYFESEKNVRMLKLKHPKSMEKLGI